MPSNTFLVGSEQDLNDALTAIDVGGTQSTPDTAYSIVLTRSIDLTTDLDAINLAPGSSLSIDGANYVLDGTGTQRGFFDYSGAVSISDLTIADTQARGGSGSGGGAGLGGGLFVASNGSANLTDVDFLDDQAIGGAGGGTGLGGGGLGGNAAAGGGGVGDAAIGDGANSYGGEGIILGTPNGAGGGGDFGNYGTIGGGVGSGEVFATLRTGGYGGGGGAGTVSLEAVNAPGQNGGGGGFGGGGGAGGAPSQYADYFPYSVPEPGGNGGDGGFGGGGGAGQVGTPSMSVVYHGYPYSQPAGGNGTPGTPGFGSGIANASTGGGGLGAGGAVFVQQGGTLVFSGDVFGGAVQGGSAGLANAGSAFGSGFFLQGNEAVTLAPPTGTTMTVADVIADQTGSGGTGANAGAGSLVIGDGSSTGTVFLSGANTYTGGTTIRSGTLELAAPNAAGTGPITIDHGATLQIDGSALPTAALDGLATGGRLDLRGVAFVPGQTVAIRFGLPGKATLDLLTVNSDSIAITATLKLDDVRAPPLAFLTAESDDHGGTLILEAAPCFATGTAIACAHGLTNVEHLRTGDRVHLVDGTFAPITWIGHRRQRQGSVVRIRPHALGPHSPARDLIVSDDHGLFFDGVLVPAGLLVNDTSITAEHRDDITFWHVELDRHAVLLAENAPAESYLDTGNRARFGNCPLGYDPVHHAAGHEPCAAMLFGGPRLDAIRARLPVPA